ncbi:uncharacterized protein LOC131876035 [Cryptomeria japonica]|uniref:uncharacterized protein LOC131876035 n=1 Tax=Cryptomeria japonica TaxID=3369 RepID=UPI0027DA5673|nr:uncharacterized protein LOC131876035 [Cryptomeria japonica]
MREDSLSCDFSISKNLNNGDEHGGDQRGKDLCQEEEDDAESNGGKENDKHGRGKTENEQEDEEKQNMSKKMRKNTNGYAAEDGENESEINLKRARSSRRKQDRGYTLNSNRQRTSEEKADQTQNGDR